MPWTSDHLEWLSDTGQRISTSDGKTVEIWELNHQEDEEVLSKWAKHFRNHYCLDEDIDYLRKGYGYTRSGYLEKIKFPDKKDAPGPSIRSGDFGEILAADYLEFIIGYWVPRTRYGNKTTRNESTRGVDIIGLKFARKAGFSNKDILAMFEAKSQLSGRKSKNKLQEAIDHSAKDNLRKGESLNAMKQRFFDKEEFLEAEKIERFQNPEDNPYENLGVRAQILRFLVIQSWNCVFYIKLT